MKKLITILMAVALIIAMAVPVFANSVPEEDLPLFENLPVKYNNAYYIIGFDNGCAWLRHSEYPFIYDLDASAFVDEYINFTEGKYSSYVYEDGIWSFLYEADFVIDGNQYTAINLADIVYASYPIYDENGLLYRAADSVFDDIGNGGSTQDTTSPAVYTVSGVYQLKQPFTLEGFDFDLTFATPVKLYSGSENYTEYNSVSMLDDGTMLCFYGNTDNGNSGVTGETYIGINAETLTYIDFGDTPQEVSENFYNWLGGNTSFFRQVPSLTQVISSSALEMVMTEIVGILPVGLTFLVGYLALRKALRVFQPVLFRA